jgi:hypothetical protein
MWVGWVWNSSTIAGIEGKNMSMDKGGRPDRPVSKTGMRMREVGGCGSALKLCPFMGRRGITEYRLPDRVIRGQAFSTGPASISFVREGTKSGI